MRTFLYPLILGFLAGVVLRSEREVALVAVAVSVGVALVLAGLYGGGHRRPLLLMVAVVIAGAALGIVRTELATPHQSPALDGMLGEKVVLAGKVIREPDTRDRQTLLTVAASTLGDLPVDARVLVHAPRRVAVAYGDTVVVKGTLREPEPFETDAGTVFNYPRYLRKDGILYQVSFAQVTHVEPGGPSLLGGLFEIKQSFLQALNRVIPEPESALAAGLLLGVKRSLGPEISEEFRTVGLTHIVVLSGFNLTVVAATILFLARPLGNRLGFLLGALAIIAFTLMAGAGAASVRAALMALLALLARSVMRPVEVLHLLVLATACMVLWNPLSLTADPGLQLSVLATAGLVVLAPRLERHLTRVPEVFGLRTIVAATLATQVAVLPLLLSLTGELSVSAVPANLLVLPLIPVTMLAAFLAGTAGLLSGALAAPLSLVAQALLSYVLTVAHVLSQVPYASVHIITIPPVVVWCLYGALGGVVAWRMGRGGRENLLA